MKIKNHTNAPEIFPFPWADKWGKDQYGIWMTFTYKEVSQRMRWIKPGQFKMGSPLNEKGRYDDETLHDVLLTNGFWLADTACTQALWQAVMGENPSHFKGSQRPVERVNRGDCRTFIARINRLIPGLKLRFPSEAQWEYACRAGTETPFWFGETITPEQVNYNSENPYHGGKKGEHRKKTVTVKSLPCNNWGLYQMHGNVWEWCADWYGNYSLGPEINPSGSDSGENLVCRGGSWRDFGRSVRSAIRFRYQPEDRYNNLGFRFARAKGRV